MRRMDARVIQTPINATAARAPASHAHSNTGRETRFARGGRRFTFGPLQGCGRPLKYRTTNQSASVMSAVAHGTAGVVLRFTIINADQTPCGTNAMTSEMRALRPSARARSVDQPVAPVASV